jgi:hypothetical protein
MTNCWVCGRSPDEVRDAVGRPMPVEAEADRGLAMVLEAKARFAKISSVWSAEVPEQFRSMDFEFVMKNAGQFRSITFIGEVEQARRAYVEALRDAAGSARKGDEVAVGEVKFSSKDQKKKEILLKGIDEFEKRSGRLIEVSRQGRHSSEHVMAGGFDGLRLGEGIKYLRDAGMLYYSIQQSLLESERAEELARKPAFGVSSTRISGYSKTVPLCTVCGNLIRKL